MAIKTGIVGLGAIGNFLIERIVSDDRFKLSAVNDIDSSRYEQIKERLDSAPPHMELRDFPDDVDVFVECASVNAVESVVTEAISRGKIVIVASIGGFVDNPELLDKVTKSDGKVILPSGAIGGLDILKALEKDEIIDVSLVTRKNPESLPKGFVDPDEETEIYCGNAREAIKRFPKNINVAALLSIAGIGLDRTKVKIISDPSIDLNTHEIHIDSKAGRYQIICRNKPFPDNPASSMLAAKSIWATLQSLTQKVVTGL